MNVNGVGRHSYYEKAEKTGVNRKNGGSGFYESLSENIGDRTGTGQKNESTPAAKSHVTGPGYPYHAVGPHPGRYESGKVSAGAVSEREAKNITYQESDYVKVYAEQGFTLMAQVNVDGRNVYIEKRQDEGTVKGFEICVDKLEKDIIDPVEQMALEAWEQKVQGTGKTDSEGDTEMTVEEALLSFYEFIEDRIKNGPPKFLIGASELSVAEWDKLLDSVDGQIDEIKEEMRERIEKMKEQQLQAELAKGGESRSASNKESDDEEIAEELLETLFQNKVE